MGKKIIISESQLERLAKSIAEAVSGYDDIFVMGQHAGHSMALLHETGKDLLTVLLGLMRMIDDPDMSFVDIKENLKAANDLIGEVIKIMEVVFQDFSEKSTIEKGEYLIDKLRKFSNRIRPILEYSEDDLDRDQVTGKVKELIVGVFNDFNNYFLDVFKTHVKFKERMDKFKPQARPEDN